MTSDCGQMGISKALQDGEPIYTLWANKKAEHYGTLTECKQEAEVLKSGNRTR